MAAKKIRVLFAEDDPGDRIPCADFLRAKGFDVTEVTKPEQAIDCLRDTEIQYDIIILDLVMPEKSGIKFYREIKAADRWKKVPIIIVTGVSEDMRKFLSSRHQVPPPEGYLSKPINPEEILDLIGKLAPST